MLSSNMTSRFTRSASRPFVALLLVALVGTVPSATASQKGKKKKAEAAAGMATGLTWPELQSAVMGYTDNLVLQVSQAIEDMLEHLEGDARIAALKLRFEVANSAFALGSNPNPDVALLDAVVLTTLVRRSVDAYWTPEYFGEEGTRLAATLRALEEDVWSLARKTLDADQEAELRRLLDDWTASHRSEWRLTAYERFSDFAEQRLQSSARRSGKTGGLFAPIRQATEAADEALLLAERALFLLKRQSTLLVFQAEELIAIAAADPDLRQVLDDTSLLAGSMERLASLTESLPDTLDEQTGRTLEEVEALLDRQRRELIRAVEEQEPVLRALVADIRAAVEAGAEMTRSLEAVTDSTDALLARLGVDAPTGAPPPTLEEVRATLAAAAKTSQDLNRLLESTDALLRHPAFENGSEGIQGAVAALEALVERFLDRLFLRALILVVILLVGAVGAALFYRWIAVKLGP